MYQYIVYGGMLIICFGIIFGASLLIDVLRIGTKAQRLRWKFEKLGVLAGRTKKEIMEIVGNPNAVSGTVDGKMILQWMATGYHVALIFKNNVCEGVCHEFSL